MTILCRSYHQNDMDVFRCDGCKIHMSSKTGYIHDEDTKLHWCPHCAFKLQLVTPDQYMIFAHWLSSPTNYAPFLQKNGDIGFKLKSKRIKSHIHEPDPISTENTDLS